MQKSGKKIPAWGWVAMAAVLAIVIFAVTRPPKIGSDALIYISPSTQSGNHYADGTTTEQQNMYRVAEQVVKILERRGCRVEMSGEGFTLDDAIGKSNQDNAVLHVALHSNAAGIEGASVRGCEVYYKSGNSRSKSLADSVYKKMEALTPDKDRGVKATDSLYELNSADAAAAILVETDFHDNAAGSEWLTSNTKQIAEAVAEGILAYIGMK